MADTLAAMLARAATKPAVRRFNDNEAKLAETIAAGIVSSGLYMSGEVVEDATAYSAGSINAYAHGEAGMIVFTGIEEEGVSLRSIQRPPDPTKLTFLTIANDASAAFRVGAGGGGSTPQGSARVRSTGQALTIDFVTPANTSLINNSVSLIQPGQQMTLVYDPITDGWNGQSLIVELTIVTA